MRNLTIFSEATFLKQSFSEATFCWIIGMVLLFLSLLSSVKSFHRHFPIAGNNQLWNRYLVQTIFASKSVVTSTRQRFFKFVYKKWFLNFWSSISSNVKKRFCWSHSAVFLYMTQYWHWPFIKVSLSPLLRSASQTLFVLASSNEFSFWTKVEADDRKFFKTPKT